MHRSVQRLKLAPTWPAYVAAVALLLLGGGTARAEEYWYRIELGGTPAGWMVAREAEQAGRRISESSTRLALKRGGTTLSLEMASRFVESADGKPLRAWTRQLLGQAPIERRYEFLADGVRVVTEQGGERREERRPLPDGEWLTPFAAQGEIRRQLAAGADRFTIRTLDPQLGLQVVEVTWQRQAGVRRAAVNGEEREVYRFLQRLSYAPALETTIDVTADGLPVRTTTPLMGLEMTAVLTDRETALETAGAPELLVQSFVYPDRPIERPREARRAVYRVKSNNGGVLVLPSTGSQRAEPREDGVRVTVAVGSSPPVDRRGLELQEYLRASTFIDHRAPAIRRLLAQATAGLPADAGDAARAEALRAFVGDYLSEKNLNSLLATATEVAASRAGDCTEHSVLLTALLRAAGIPARVVTGLVYVDHFAGSAELFGYHMWSQALVGDRWLDLDATTPRPFDAAHLAFSTTALNDDQGALLEMASIVPLIGALEVDVLEVEY